MRTTLNIAEDVLFAAKELARRENRSAGEVISDLARRGLQASGSAQSTQEPDVFYGFCPLPERGVVVTNEMIDRLLDDE